MMAAQLILPHPALQSVALSLVHFVWQGSAVLLIACGAMWLAKRGTAAIRYWILLVSLVGMAACPLGTFLVLEQQRSRAEPAFVPARQSDMQSASLPSAADRSVQASAHAALNDLSSQTGDDRPGAFAPSSWENIGLPVLLIFWLVGALVCGLRLIIGWTGGRWFVSGASPAAPASCELLCDLAKRLGVRGNLRMLTSDRVREVIVVGAIRPVILLPTAWLANLPPDVLEAVLLHELAHIRRHDLWVNTLQRLVETVLFYHPAVWWISKQLRLEREKCCDELAAVALGDRLSYARSLEHVALQFVAQRRPLLALSFGDQKMELLTRVRHVLGVDAARTSLASATIVRTGPAAEEYRLLKGLKTQPGRSFATADVQSDISAVKAALALEQVVALTLNTPRGAIVVFAASAQ